MRPGRVALEVDGQPWRTVPDEVVLRCGLAPGTQLDRARLRLLRRELRQAEAVERALRAIARRPLSERALERRLADTVGGAPARAGAVARLKGAGLLDDRAHARARAEALAAGGWGDRAVEARLELEGFRAEAIRAAVATLDPEPERARRVAAAAADPKRTWALLARRGFEPDSAEAALGAVVDDGP